MKIIFSKTPQKLTAEDVSALYREHLGREVESQEVLLSHLNGHSTVESLRLAILDSEEYHTKSEEKGVWDFLKKNISRPAAAIQVDVSPGECDALFERISKQWSKLGKTDAHWSVVTHEKYRAPSFEANAAAFYASGRHTASLIDLFEARNGIKLDRSRLLELGCGTGRSTACLAEKFGAVTAVDISPGHLALCRKAVHAAGRSNVDFLQLHSPADLATLPPCTFFFSVIVLQHNPPPLAHHMLDCALAKVAPGGAALFQVPTHFAGYKFSTREYLASPEPPSFEMHCLPMHRVFRLLHKHGFLPLEVLMDTWTGLPGSHTFFAIKA